MVRTAQATAPGFRLNQQVCFSGGIGIIKNYQSEAQTWAYVIEMELGPEPEIGRLGAETMILLNEAEIHSAVER